jgi:hypothetical protein
LLYFAIGILILRGSGWVGGVFTVVGVCPIWGAVTGLDVMIPWILMCLLASVVCFVTFFWCPIRPLFTIILVSWQAPAGVIWDELGGDWAEILGLKEELRVITQMVRFL